MPGTAPTSGHILQVSMSSLICYLRQLVPDRCESVNLLRVTVRFGIGLGAAAAHAFRRPSQMQVSRLVPDGSC